MKIVKCSNCKLEREVEDKILISICYTCQEEMLEVVE